jgi:N-dimethylarginine dimethylaminohydrolase
VRRLFERIATETEEDYQNLIAKLESFGVKVMRPTMPEEFKYERYTIPPMSPRDHMVMIGNKLHRNDQQWFQFYQQVKDLTWPNLPFDLLPQKIQQECVEVHGWQSSGDENYDGCYKDIFQHIRDQGNQIVNGYNFCNGAMTTRVGKDLYIGTEQSTVDVSELNQQVRLQFPDHRTHVITTGGHTDGSFCPVAPGLIVSLHDMPNYVNTFPDWEVVYLPNQSWNKVQPFLQLKRKNKGKWWIPGFEHDQDVINTVEQWLGHWTGYVEETVFDVNMLIVDPKNVIVFNHNNTVFEAFARYGITPHVVPFRHRYFWDGGIHCITTDLDRQGTQQDYFPERNNNV